MISGHVHFNFEEQFEMKLIFSIGSVFLESFNYFVGVNFLEMGISVSIILAMLMKLRNVRRRLNNLKFRILEEKNFYSSDFRTALFIPFQSYFPNFSFTHILTAGVRILHLRTPSAVTSPHSRIIVGDLQCKSRNIKF